MTIALVTKTAAAVLLATFNLTANASAQSSLSIPRPDPEFKGKIGETLKDSTPSYPQPLKAPKGAPNVLLILLDDVGFGHVLDVRRTGADADTRPAREQRAEVQPLPHHGPLHRRPRAALLAGRNHHTCGTGVIIEMGTGYPGLHRDHPAERRDRPGDPPRQRLRHRHVRQVRTTRRSPRSARPARSTAGRPAWGSTTSTGSTRARRTSTTR